MIVALAGTVFWTGCQQSQPRALTLQERLDQITVGQTNSTEVLNMLPEEGMLQSSSSVSVLNKGGWYEETGLVTFDEDDAQVKSKVYIQHRSKQMLIITDESLMVAIATVIPDEVLNEPYETDTRKYLALLKHVRKELAADAEPFTEDRPTESLIAMARDILHMGILTLTEQPRRGHELVSDDGLTFDHPVMRNSYVKLIQHEPNLFTIKCKAHSAVDPWDNW